MENVPKALRTDGASEILVAKAASRTMNPSYRRGWSSVPSRRMQPQRWPNTAQTSESIFRSLFDFEVVEAAIDRGCFERPRVPGLRYDGFVELRAVLAAATA